MSKFHAGTLQLLGAEGASAKQPVAKLIHWAKDHGVTLPGAYLDWASIDQGDLLRKYSNDDKFFFQSPELVVTPEGLRGILFSSENQGNFEKIVTLEQGDDPPVLFAWIGKPPWVTYCERFSDCVYAQIFDWQYLLEFRADDPAFKEITYYGDIHLNTTHCVGVLRRQFQETVTTRDAINGKQSTAFRFLKSLKERMTVLVADDGLSHIRVTGPYALVAKLEADLLELFSAEVVPRPFNSVLWVVGFLGSCIDQGCISQLRHACVEKPEEGAIARLAACHRAKPLRERFRETGWEGNLDFPQLGGDEWGVTIRFRRENEHWCTIATIN